MSRPNEIARFGFLRGLWAAARALFDNDVARDRLYAVRGYQIKAAIQAALIALAGRNASIELPTGTGKTLIACIAAVLWKSQRPASRILLIVPSRTLVEQHFEVARWVAQHLVVDRLSDQHSGDPGALRRTLLCGDFIVSTPGVLASALERGVVDDEVVASFDLIIADEFDQFVVLDEDDRETVARYQQHWRRLTDQLPAAARYLVKSATLGVAEAPAPAGRRSKARRRAALIGRLLNPVSIVVPQARYAAVVPFQPVQPVRFVDSYISQLLEAVSVAKGRAHLRLTERLGPLDYRDIERRAPQICGGPVDRTVQMRLAGAGFRPVFVNPETRQAFCTITGLMMMPQHILEDLTLGFDVEYGDCFIATAENEEKFLPDAPILIDEREDNHFRFQAGSKSDGAIAIATRRGRRIERGVLFLRTITLLEALKPLLAPTGLPLFELTGEMGDWKRRQAIGGFRDSPNGLLLMTRTTGGRGLDLPFAHYAIFYSPKTDPVAMWQEMSRIRSTVSNPKDIYVLCHGAEIAKLQGMAEALAAQGRRVTCTPIVEVEPTTGPRASS